MPTLTISATAKRDLATAWDRFVPAALSDVFPKSKGPVPAVINVTDQTGRWDEVGRSRRVHLGDGAVVTEEITLSNPSGGATLTNGKAEFGYKVYGFQFPFGLLTSEATGFWTFSKRDGETQITWTYTFTPTHLVTRPIMSLLIATFWKAYMTDGLAHVVRIIEEDAEH